MSDYKFINSLINNLVRQRSYLNKIIFNISEILLVVNKEGIFIDLWTPHNTDLLLDADSVLGKHISHILPSYLAFKLDDKMSEVLDNDKTEIFDYNLFVGDSNKYFEAKLVRLEAEKVLIIIRNITESVEKEKKIEYLSLHDELTGLYNRRYINSEVKKLSNSRKLPISIIIGDLDKLKIVNDNYGHTQGDKYIKKAAKILKCTFRDEDIIARIGGDEFAVLLPETDRMMAEKICDRIRISFEKTNKNDELPIPLSISLGSATMTNDDNDLIKYYKEADKKIYKN